MLPARVTAGPRVLCLAFAAVLTAGCSGDLTSAGAPTASTSPGSPSAVADPDAPPATVEGLEDEVAPPDASFPASTADDSGEERAGSAGGADGDMSITGVRLLPQNGYDRLIIDLDTTGIPFWTARYTEASTAAGDPVEVAGDSYLRLGLFTENSSAAPVPVVAGQGGVVAEVRSAGSLGGYQEVLIGVHGAPAPFRTFGLTDPGRVVVDIRPAG